MVTVFKAAWKYSDFQQIIFNNLQRSGRIIDGGNKRGIFNSIDTLNMIGHGYGDHIGSRWRVEFNCLVINQVLDVIL